MHICKGTELLDSNPSTSRYMFPVFCYQSLYGASWIPLRRSRRCGLALSSGVSPYLLQMLTWAPLVTRSWGGEKRQKRKCLCYPSEAGLCVCVCACCRTTCIASGRSRERWRLATRGSTHLGHQVLAPEAGVVQRRVAMLVGRIGVRLALNQLEDKSTAQFRLETGLRGRQCVNQHVYQLKVIPSSAC